MAKKVLSIALALLMIVNVFAVAVSATVWTDEKATITLSSDNAKPQPGDEVTVTVSLENNYNVHGLQIMLAYDKNYYDVVGDTTEDVFTNLLVSDGAKFTGVVQSFLGAAEQEAMYAGLYSAAQKAQYGLLRVGYAWLASQNPTQGGSTPTPVFSEKTDLVSFKLKVKANAPEGFGAVMVDPTFVVETGTDVPAFDTRSATYVGKGAATIAESATSGKLYGLPINVDGAKLEACKHDSLAATAAVEATHTTDGNIAYWTCEACDAIFSDANAKTEITLADTVIAKTGHDDAAGIEWTTDAANHSKVCSCGEVLVTEPHDFEWVIDTDSTCDTEGVQHEECTVCAYTRNEGTAVDKKQHNIVFVEAKDATCTEAGNVEHYYCDGCDKYYADEAGAEELAEEDIVIAALGHSTTKTDAKDAECEAEGNIAYWTCSVCGKIYSDEACETEIELADTVIPATGHTEGEWEQTKAPTLDEKGEETLFCAVCGEALDTRDLPALGEGPADYEELNALVAEAEAIDRDALEDESVAAVDAILDEIEYGLQMTYQGKVDAWADALAEALAALKYDVSKAEAKVTTVLDKKTVVADDIITVTVKLTTNYPVATIQLPILYDKTQFALVGFTSGKSYLTFADGSFAAGSYDFNGSAGLTNGFRYTSDAAKWNTDSAKAQYDYAWITASFNAGTNPSNLNLVIPNDEEFVTFQLKALKDVEDAAQSVFISPDWAKTSDVRNGQFVIGFSATEVNTNPLTYVTMGMNYTLETIAQEGYAVTGKVTSFATNQATSETELTTIELIADGEVKYSTTVAGTGAQDYSLAGVAAGTYTVKVSKANHATREYEVTVEDALEMDLKIHLLGDVSGDGKITVADYTKVLKHAKQTDILEGYEFVCADATADGKVTVADYTKVLKHAKQTDFMW